MFAPTLKEMIELKREAGQRMAEGTSRSAYEALLDEYEPDASVADLRIMFDDLRRPLVELIDELARRPPAPGHDNLARPFSAGKAAKILSRSGTTSRVRFFAWTLG